MPEIRRGRPGDLSEIAAIQAASPETPQWRVEEYLQYDLRVASIGNRLAGYLAARSVAADEHEILNLAVAPEFRRQGIARQLVNSLTADFRGAIFLEVRESNRVALNLYKSMGFQQISRRAQYYEFPDEAAIVMKFHSC